VDNRRAAPVMSLKVAVQEDMWTIFMQTTASARSMGHVSEPNPAPLAAGHWRGPRELSMPRWMTGPPGQGRWFATGDRVAPERNGRLC
jgi:hypothetical protein